MQIPGPSWSRESYPQERARKQAGLAGGSSVRCAVTRGLAVSPPGTERMGSQPGNGNPRLTTPAALMFRKVLLEVPA